MTPTTVFTPKFYDTKTYASEPTKRSAQSLKPIILSGPEYRGIFSLNFCELSEFKTCQKEYIDLLDRIGDFAKNNSDKITPTLSARSVGEIKTHFDMLQNHISDLNVDFFGPHKEMIYGPGKELFHELSDLLQNEKIPLQKRMNAVATMAPSMGTCSGGVLTALQEAVSSLKHSTGGIKGAAYRTKVQMMESLISQHVREVHGGYQRGNEVHFVNAYFNYIAKDMGVPERVDQFTRVAEADIAASELEKCRDMVLTKLNPSALTKVMASNYLDQVKGAQKVDVSQPVRGDDLTDVFMRSHDIKQATLNGEFGEVPDQSYLLPVTDADSYQFTRQSTLIAKHFMKALKDEDIVNYDDAISLISDKENGEIKILGDLFWRDRDGSCEELAVKDLISISPVNISNGLNDSRVSSSDQGIIFNGIARNLLDSREVENIEGIPDAWLAHFADLFQKGVLTRSQVVPVVHLAAHFGCPETLRALIRNEADIDIKDPQGYTPLMLAAHSGNASAVSQLLAAGADPALTTPQGDNALMLCGRLGHALALRALIQHRAVNINAQNPSRCSALMLAGREGHVDALIALIHARADLTLKDTQGRSALALARLAGHATVVQILEAATQPPPQGQTLLMACVQQGRTEVVQAWVRHGEMNIDAQNPEGMTALMMAADGRQLGALRALLDAGAHPDIQNHRGRTAMHLAMGSAPTEILRALLDAGANTDVPAPGNLTVAMMAAFQRNPDKLVDLIEAGANMSIRGRKGTARDIARQRHNVSALKVLDAAARKPQRGETLLMMCARRGDTQALRLFIQHGRIDINAQNPRGMTATMLAAQGGRLDAVIALIEAKADLSLRDHQNCTAAMIAQKRRNNATASIVLDMAARAQESGETPLMLCARDGHTEAVQALIQHSATNHLNTPDRIGMTALMKAAQGGHFEVLKALLRARANPNIQAQGDFTAMHIAAQKGHAEAVRALLAAGAWVNVQSAGGYTPTMLAAAAGSVDTLTALIEAKADLSLRNRRGDSADMIAESRQHPAAFSVLDNALFDSWRATLRAGGDLERHPWTARHALPQGLAHP